MPGQNCHIEFWTISTTQTLGSQRSTFNSVFPWHDTVTLLKFSLPSFEDTSSLGVFMQNHRPPVSGSVQTKALWSVAFPKVKEFSRVLQGGIPLTCRSLLSQDSKATLLLPLMPADVTY